MPSPLSQHPRHGLPIAMHNRGLLPPLELPTRRANPEAKIRIASGAHALRKAPNLLERQAPHRSVRSLRKRPLVIGQRDLLTHRRLQPRIPSRHRRVALRRLLIDNRASQNPHPLARRPSEIATEQVRRRQNVRVEKHKPFRGSARHPTIASEVRGLQRPRPQHDHIPHSPRSRGARPVVHNCHAVPGRQRQTRKPLHNPRKRRIRAPKRQHNINRRAPAHSPQSTTRGRYPPPVPILASPWGRSSVG